MSPLARLRPLALALAMACSMQSLGVQAQVNQQRLPNIGDGNGMSLAQERRLGESIMRQLVTDADYMDDPVLIAYLQGVWQSLRGAAKQIGNLSPELDEAFTWELLLVRDKSVNAFALPGGYMGVHLGLIAVVSNRDELASVMGHELSHVTQRHIARMQEQQGKQTPWLVGAMILGVLAASRSPDTANALIMGGTAGVAQGQLNFSRDMEREADRLGFNVMSQAGFAQQGMVGMFEKLGMASRLNDSGGYPYLRSHPLTTERIGDMQSRIGLKTAAPVATTLEHQMMAARARFLMARGVDGVQVLSLALERDWTADMPLSRQVGLLYAGAMAYAQQGQAAKARDALTRLLALTRADPDGLRAAQWLAADTERRLGNPQGCVQALNKLPSDRPGVLLLAQCQLDLKQITLAKDASESLQGWVAEHPRDSLAWELAAQALNQSAEPLRALRFDAEARAVRWDESGAIDRLRAAQALSKNLSKEGKLDRAGNLEASIIDSRLRALEAVRRELLRPQN
jgi:predicted Zn-dependent protease